MKRVGIIQPNYLPWRGYFHFIKEVDIFIFLDDVQYTKRDWRNRNRFRMLNGQTVWLTVPVESSQESLIKDVLIKYDSEWVNKHILTLQHNYKNSPFFNEYFEKIKNILRSDIKKICDLNIILTKNICSWLGIKTPLLKSSDLKATGSKDVKLIDIVKSVGGTHYLSGPAAKDYIQPCLWNKAGISLEYMNYPDYPEYRQISSPFDPAVSILDLLFMVGSDAPKYIWQGDQKAATEVTA